MNKDRTDMAHDADSRGLTAEEINSVAGGTLTGEILSNVSKTRSEISMTFARNARA
jgi:hypothetical protein